MLKPICTALLLAAVIMLAPHAWGLDFQAGRYQITSSIRMPDMPGSPPQTTITRCMTPQDPVPDQSVADSNCKVLDMKTEGNTVTWKVECRQEGQTMKGSGKMTYAGDRFEGTLDTVMVHPHGNMTMNTTIKGKRVGDCP
ncbi:MAG: DUF3617 family protein [Desulfobacterales bacterium]|nr:DUF3617 family protein [Desulfobacterales bacterium]MDJ0889486.1 DUF3617 family protein [Desulfobacterales bacterium]